VGFDSIVREAIEIIDGEVKDLEEPVRHWRCVRVSPTGAKVMAPGDPIVHMAIVERNPKIHYRRDGITLPVKARIIILKPFAPEGTAGRSEPVDVRDEFVLRDGLTGPVLENPGLIDPSTSRPYFLEVLIGGASSSTSGSGA